MNTAHLPAEMTAMEIIEPDALHATTRPLPQPGPGEVLIRVAAAGVNRPDCLQRKGLYPPPPGASDLPGLEVAGTVVACGENVRNIKINTQVCALLTGGGYAEYCVAPAVQCLPVPDGLSLTEAAALPETLFTVWSNVFDRGRLTSGETLLVHGGASGIGTTAIQMAHAFGIRVFTTVGSDQKRKLCEELGADAAINYRQENFADIIGKAVEGVDVILDIVGAKHLDANTKLLNPGGRLVIIGLLGGAKSEINLGRILTKRLTVTGSTLRARSAAFKGDIADSLRSQVWPKLESGDIKPVIQATFPLAEAIKAHEILDANEAMGKVVLTVTE